MREIGVITQNPRSAGKLIRVGFAHFRIINLPLSSVAAAVQQQ
jgi:hypothetical protein